MGVKYYHVCGGTEFNCNHSKEKKWAVYTPHGESCANVKCEPGLSCCDASSGTCNGVNDNECGNAQTRHCTNPKGGTQTSADETLSGCPALGLNDCSYKLPCEATSPGILGTGPTSYCSDKRQGVDTCSFPVDGTCNPHTTGWHSSMPNLNGTCSFPGTSYTESCTATYTTRCSSHCNHYNCSCCSTCTVPCGPLESCTTKTEDCNCQPCYCNHGCHDYDYKAVVKYLF